MDSKQSGSAASLAMASSSRPVWRSLIVTWLMQWTVPLTAEVTKLIRLRWWGVSLDGHFSVAA